MTTVTLYGKVLRKIRIDYDLTFKKLSEKFDGALSPAYLSAIETGRRAIPQDLSID